MCIYRLPINDPHPAGRLLTYENDAHVITQGLGRNGNIFPPGVVCDDCNRYFGNKLEPALIRHPTLAYDMQRLSVPGKDGGPRDILGNWRRESDGGVLVPMAPPRDGGKHQDRPLVEMLPILDPCFDQLQFRRGLHLLAFNVLAYLHSTGQVSGEAYDPRDVRYDAVRTYIRALKRPTDAWPLLERYDPPAVGGKVEYELYDWGGVIIGKIRAFSFEFYVELTNTGNLLPWAEGQGISHLRLIAPGARYPASPTEDEVPLEKRWWLRFYKGEIWILSPKGEGYRFTPVGERFIVRGAA